MTDLLAAPFSSIASLHRILTGGRGSPGVPGEAEHCRRWLSLDRLRQVALFLLLVTGLMLTGSNSFAQNKHLTPSGDRPAGSVSAPAADYTGTRSCGGCHPRQTAIWATSHHAKAMQPVQPGSVLGQFTGQTVSDGGITARLSGGSDHPVMRTGGPEGQEADFPVIATLGVYPLQQYLTRLPGGRIQLLPLAWDARPRSDGGQRWFNPAQAPFPSHAPASPAQPAADPRRPAEKAFHWTGLNQSWNSLCGECHSTDFRKNPLPEGRGYNSQWSDDFVGCEACHGPGQQHLVWSSLDAASRAKDSSKGWAFSLRESPLSLWGDYDRRGIRTPPPAAQQDQRDERVCAPCHARRRLISPRQDAGMPLSERSELALLTDGLYQPDGQAQDEVFEYGSFAQSKMHLAGVRCQDCHDPHSGQIRASGNALCSQCHDPARFDQPAHSHHRSGSSGADCIACHMPQRTYMGIHRRHDHGFRIPRPQDAQATGSALVCTSCHRDKNADWAAGRLKEWTSPPAGESLSPLAAAFAAARQGQPVAGWSRLAQDGHAPAILRATALHQLGQSGSTTALPVLAQGLNATDPLVRLAALHALDTQAPDLRWRLASSLLQDPVRAVRISAGRLLAGSLPSNASEAQRTALQQALTEWRQAEHLAEDRPETHLNLGALAAELGDLATAATEFRQALTLDPGFTTALVNLADVSRLQGDNQQAETLLRQALSLTPEDPDISYALALTLVRLGRQSEALTIAEAARRRSPDDPALLRLTRLLQQSPPAVRPSR